MSVLDININWFESHYEQSNPNTVNLISWLSSKKYYEQQKAIMSCEDKDHRTMLKQSMPCITPSLYMGNHTGLIGIDIDEEHNKRSIADIRQEVIQFEEVAYCGKSVSGRGIWLLIPIADPDDHWLHFLSLQKAFKALGITIDASCKNINRLRYYAYDEQAYFNHHATQYQNKHEPIIKGLEYRYSDISINTKELLEKHGWLCTKDNGQNKYLRRPGKTSGISGVLFGKSNVFFNFSSNAAPFDGWKGYAPISVYAMLEHGSNFKKAVETLKSMNK